jgi:sulfoxide reductase catalytic subunit YedY
MVKINSSEITPKHVYLSRRRFMVGVGALVANSVVLAACGKQTPSPTVTSSTTSPTATLPTATMESTPSITESTPVALPTLSATADELEDELTSYDAIANYTNYYEFTVDKEQVARTCSSSNRKNASTACAVSRPGQWSFPG